MKFDNMLLFLSISPSNRHSPFNRASVSNRINLHVLLPRLPAGSSIFFVAAPALRVSRSTSFFVLPKKRFRLELGCALEKKNKKSRDVNHRPLAWLGRNGSALAHYSTMPAYSTIFKFYLSPCEQSE